MDSMNPNQYGYYPTIGSLDLQSIMRQVYIWMVLGLLLTTIIAFFTVTTSLINLVASPVVLIIAIIAEMGVVLLISLGFNRLSAAAATMLFFLYAALNGFTLSVILLAFSIQTVFLAFASTTALFGAMTIIGYTTKLDLSRLGTYLLMALIGLIIAMVVNIFVNSGPLDMIVSIAGVLIFTGLTAYDTQRIGRMAQEMSMEGDTATKFGIFGALKLYLDFINMFLFILRLFGRRRE